MRRDDAERICAKCGMRYIEHAECTYYDSKALTNECKKFVLKKKLQIIKMEWLIKDDTIRTYELIKTNLPLLLNRIRLFGKVPQKEKTPYLLSEMNEQGDVLKDWALNREQFNYIKKQLKLKVINI